MSSLNAAPAPCPAQTGSTHLLGNRHQNFPATSKMPNCLVGRAAPAKQLPGMTSFSQPIFCPHCTISVGVCGKKPSTRSVSTVQKGKGGVCQHIWFQHFLTSISSELLGTWIYTIHTYAHKHLFGLHAWNMKLCVWEQWFAFLSFFFSVYFHHSLVIFCLPTFCYSNVSSNIQNANFLLHKNVIKLSGFLYKQISAGRLMGCCIPSKEEILFNYLPYKIQ